MNSELDPLEQQLSHLRPMRLPSSARQGILHEMQRPVTRRGAAFWLSSHRAGFQGALAGALSVVVLVGSHWLPRSPRPESYADQPAFATSNALAFLEARLAAGSLIHINSVDELHSFSMLTNTQIQR